MKNTVLLLFVLVFKLTGLAQGKPVDFNNKGIEFAKNKQFEKAIKSFDQAIKADPDFVAAYSNRGQVNRLQKNYEQAISDFTASLEKGGSIDVLYSRANTYMDAKDFDNAIRDYGMIINQNPSYPSIFFDRGYAFIMLDKFEDAKKDLEEQLKRDPKDFKSLGNLIGLKKKLKLYEEALADYEILLEEFPDNPNSYILYNNRASLYQEINDYDKALIDANKSIELKGDYAIAFINRAELYMKMGDKLRACQDFETGIKLGVEKHQHFRADKDFEDLQKLCK